MAPVDVAERIRSRSVELTTAERRIAEVILESPQSVGFGTVAELAKAAEVGAASVVRLAGKLGFEGYTELQQAVQAELLAQLRPAAERIRATDRESTSLHADTEAANVHETLSGVDRAALTSLVERLADVRRPVAVMSGDASRGIAHQFVAQLHQLRHRVTLVAGGDVEALRDVAVAEADTTFVVVDLRRYERWVLDAHRAAATRGLWSAGVTDSMLSPIASAADVAFVVRAASSGPFDSHVGTLALLNLIAIEVAVQLKDSATERLAAIEAAWSTGASLTDGT